MKPQPYALTTPCAQCPFRSDIGAYLTPERVEEIERSLERSEFPCHKTTTHDDEDGEFVETGKEVHCTRIFKNPFGDHMDGVPDATLTKMIGLVAAALAPA